MSGVSSSIGLVREWDGVLVVCVFWEGEVSELNDVVCPYVYGSDVRDLASPFVIAALICGFVDVHDAVDEVVA